ncbi:MAG: hypothetical protein R6X13_08705 [bacterium]
MAIRLRGPAAGAREAAPDGSVGLVARFVPLIAVVLKRGLWRRLNQMLTLRLWPAFDAYVKAPLTLAPAARFGPNLTGLNACLLDT